MGVFMGNRASARKIISPYIRLTLVGTIYLSIIISPHNTHANTAEKLTVYISTSGNDAWSGLFPSPNSTNTDGPFATLERARNVLRELKQAGRWPSSGEVIVYLRGGKYELKYGFELNIEDSGKPNLQVIWQPYREEIVHLIGGVQLIFAKATKNIGAEAKQKIPKSSQENIYSFDLAAQGISNFGTMTTRGMLRPIYPAALQLILNGRFLPLAGWPNNGWAEISATPDGRYGGNFTFNSERLQRWVGVDELWMHGYWMRDYADSYEKVKSIDISSNTIFTMEPHGVKGYGAGQRFRVIGILEELDEAGEWYLDRNSGIIYIWPPADMGTGDFYASMLEETLISFHDVSHVTLRNIIVEVTRGVGIEISGGSGNIISECTIRNIGNIGVRITGGRSHSIIGCNISYTGDGGISLNAGDRTMLTPSNHIIKDNNIHHFGQWVRTYQPAIKIEGVGSRILNNKLHDGPHSAIWLQGNDHLIESNEIFKVGYDTGDVGAIYIGFDWTERGNIIRYNYFHDIRSVLKESAKAIYLDDLSSGTLVYGNIFNRVDWGVFIGGGRDNRVENNIFIENTLAAVHLDSRGLGWAKWAIIGNGPILAALVNMNYKNPPWSTKYPELVDILDKQPGAPLGNSVARNIIYKSKWLNLKGGAKFSEVDSPYKATVNDFVFDDYGNLELIQTSAAFGWGFKAIPFSPLGLQH